MKIIRIPAQRNTGKIRIAVYCRVSTKLQEQEDSLDMQEKAYVSLIRIRSDWKLVGVYSDSSSALSAKKRPEFMRMINDALDGKFDRILCKSVSRFSRNVAECKKYTDMLRMKNVAVEFEKERLKTDEPASSFIFSLMSVIAENESRSLSENVKWSYRERFKRGEYNLGNNRILGYDSVDGRLVPNEDAGIVQSIFHMYMEGKFLKEITETLSALGLTGRSGRPLTEQGVLYILGNEAYAGDKCLQKRAPKDFLTKQPEKNAPYESRYLTDDHEAVIGKELWNMAQKKLQERLNDIANGVRYHGGRAHFLYGKVFCGECGAPLTRRTLRKRFGERSRIWTCRERHRGCKGNGCKMRNILESELLAAICRETGYNMADSFPVERFKHEIERVDICRDEIKVTRRKTLTAAMPEQ